MPSMSKIKELKDSLGTVLWNVSRPVEKKEKSTKVAKAAIEKSSLSSKASKAFSKARIYTNEKASAFSNSSFGKRILAVLKAVRDFFSPKARNERRLLEQAKAADAKAKAEYNIARDAQISQFSKNAKELVKAIKGFENIDSETNEYATARRRYLNAAETFLKDLASLDGKVSREEFFEIIKNANKKEYRRIYADSRFGRAFENVKEGISISAFVNILVASRTKNLKSVYSKEIKALAEKFASNLLNMKNIQDATEFNHVKFEAINKLAENNKYKNILGKNRKEIEKDLKANIVSKLGGKDKVESIIANIEKIMNSPEAFDKGVVAARKEVEEKIAAKIQAFDDSLSSLDKKLQALLDQLEVYKKETQTLLDQVTAPTAEKCEARRKEVEADVARIKAEIKDIEEVQIKRIQDDKKLLSEQKPAAIEQIRLAYLTDLNAKRRELAKLIGSELKDIEILPAIPALKESAAKRFLKNPAVIGAGIGAIMGIGGIAATTAAKSTALAVLA